MSVSLHFIRHLPPTLEATMAVYGHEDIPLVTDHVDVVARISTLSEQLPAQAHWHISPTTRTRLTGDMLLTANPQLSPKSMQEDAGFLEQSFGALKGVLYAELADREDWKLFSADMVNNCPPQGESFQSTFDRVQQRADHLAMQDGPHVIVAHGQVLRAVIAHALHIPLAKVLKTIDIKPLAHVHFHARAEGGEVTYKLEAISQGPDFRSP